MDLPQNFIDTVINTWGDKGQRWLKELPTLISYCQEKWQLTNLKLHENLSYNCILFANRSNDTSVILKLCHPSSDFLKEIHALNAYNGQGAVKLFDCDIDKGALLMEALIPGKSLKSFFPELDEKAELIAIEVIKKLHSCGLPKNIADFPTLEQWLSSLDEANEILFASLIQRAKELAAYLLNTQSKPILLHGDLHHDNILLNNNEWVSIDPKGVIGEAAYEAGAFIRNPMPELLKQPDPLTIINNRVNLFSAHLNIERQRLIDWSFVQAVLAACWAFEDKNDWVSWIKCAQIMENLLTQDKII